MERLAIARRRRLGLPLARIGDYLDARLRSTALPQRELDS